MERFLALTANPHYFPIASKVKDLISSSPAKGNVTNEDYLPTSSEVQRRRSSRSGPKVSSSHKADSIDSELVYEFGLAVEECLEMCARWGLDDITNISDTTTESDASEEPWVILPDWRESEDFIMVSVEKA